VQGEAVPESRDRERLGQRLGPEPAQERVGCARPGSGQADPAKPPRVVVVQTGGLVEPEDARVVAFGSGSSMLGWVTSGDHGGDELPGHLQVDQQSAGAVERQDQDLAAAAEPVDEMAGDVMTVSSGDRTRPCDPGRART
jgi:hypothetical protein